MSADAEFERLIGREAREGRRLHAAWDAGRFDRLMRGPAAALRDRLEGEPHAETAVAAYATLLREAVGAGYLGALGDDPGAGPWPNFLAFGLLKLVPLALAEEPAAGRVGLLAALWNIGEGLLAGPPWVDRYVLSCAAGLRRLGALASFVAEALGPALAEAEPAAWGGPFAVATRDARAVLDGFLPGEMVLAAPRVLCVRDRRDPGQHLGLLLGHGGQSRWLGPTPPLEPYAEDAPGPDVAVAGGRARVGRHRVDLPLLGEAYRVVTAGAGFVVVSAVDSQRLWIVETP
jgi:hypothetical protein